MIRVTNSLFILLFLGYSLAASQNVYRLEFATQLLKSEQITYSGWVLDSLKNTELDYDEMHRYYHLEAYRHYLNKDFKEALKNLNKLTDTSYYEYDKAILLKSISLGYEKKYHLMQDNLKPISNVNLATIRNYALAGTSVLNSDYERFEKYINITDSSYYLVRDHVESLMQLKRIKQNIEPKSAFLAGLYSSLLPGMGKVYAGDYGSGVSAFLTNAALGAMFYENFRKDGIKDPKTIIFGTLFSAFYIGNIWGSVVNVKVHNQILYDGINQQILLELHIPLRTVFKL